MKGGECNIKGAEWLLKAAGCWTGTLSKLDIVHSMKSLSVVFYPPPPPFLWLSLPVVTVLSLSIVFYPCVLFVFYQEYTAQGKNALHSFRLSALERSTHFATDTQLNSDRRFRLIKIRSDQVHVHVLWKRRT